MAGSTFPLGAATNAGTPKPQPLDWMMRLVSRVTAPLRARALPLRVAPVCIAIEVKAMMLPMKVVEVAMVAELPTCQKT